MDTRAGQAPDTNVAPLIPDLRRIVVKDVLNVPACHRAPKDEWPYYSDTYAAWPSLELIQVKRVCVTSWGFDVPPTDPRRPMGISSTMAIGPFNILTTKGHPKAAKTRDGTDVAARYFVYKLYEATDGWPMQWQVLLGRRASPGRLSGDGSFFRK